MLTVQNVTKQIKIVVPTLMARVHPFISEYCSDSPRLELDGFRDEASRENGLAICSPEQGTRWLTVESVRHNTQCCSGVNQVLVTGHKLKSHSLC
jgi:hypothetical protein